MFKSKAQKEMEVLRGIEREINASYEKLQQNKGNYSEHLNDLDAFIAACDKIATVNI